MKKLICMTILGGLAAGQCVAAETPDLQAKLHAMEITIGKWRYQGETLAVGDQKAEKWTWTEQCGWSPNHAFVTCAFTMNYPGKVVKSQVVDSYNSDDQSYWHYEMFDSDESGAKPFISKLDIAGDTWTTFGTQGQKTYRVTYRFTSPKTVSLRIETTDDKINWTLLARADGTRL